MQIQDIKPILDAPPCPKIMPREEPCLELPPLQFTLESNQNSQVYEDTRLCTNNQPTKSQIEDIETCQMLDEEDEKLSEGKRSFSQFMGIKSRKMTISRTLTLPFWKPRKLVSK